MVIKMKKNFKTVKATLIMGLLLISMLVAIVPNTSAGIIGVNPLLQIRYNSPKDFVMPNSDRIIIDVNTTMKLSGIGATSVETSSLLKDVPIQIELKVIWTESWCTAAIDNSIFSIKPSDTSSYQSQLTITVTENVPAFTQGIVRIEAKTEKQAGLFFNINEALDEFDISFQAGYYPVISYDIPQGTLIEIGPMDTADFEIGIENIGNGITYVSCEILDIPSDDWSVNIASSVTLSSAVSGMDATEKTVHLKIKPPFGFGYHEDRKTIRVKLTPSYLGRPELKGQEEIITFTIQSRGFSPGAGFEIPLIVITLVVVIFIFYTFDKRRRK